MSPAEQTAIRRLQDEMIVRLDQQDIVIAATNTAIASLSEEVRPAVELYKSLAKFAGAMEGFGRELARIVKWSVAVGASITTIAVGLHVFGLL